MIRLNERYTKYLIIPFNAPILIRFRLAWIKDIAPNFHVLSRLTSHRFIPTLSLNIYIGKKQSEMVL